MAHLGTIIVLENFLRLWMVTCMCPMMNGINRRIAKDAKPYLLPSTQREMMLIRSERAICLMTEILQTTYLTQIIYCSETSFETTFRASNIASLSLWRALSTSSSAVKLNDARTYAVFEPFGKNTVPGRARTPFSNAFVLITASESPSSTRLLGFNNNLNLGQKKIGSEKQLSNLGTTFEKQNIFTRKTCRLQVNSIQPTQRGTSSLLPQKYLVYRDKTPKHVQYGF